MIIVISHAADPHAGRVIAHLEAAGQEPLLLNLAELPNHATLTLVYHCCGNVSIDYRRANGALFALDRARSVWWRRPQAADPSSVTDQNLRLFTANEWHEAINGLWQLLRKPWMNDPTRDEVAARKALQLKIAQEVGLRIPRTLITSDPEQARQFVASQGLGATIYKTFSCTHAIWRETRLLQADDLELLDSVQLAPVIFQEFVPAGVDLRITAVGRSLFAAAIRPEDGEARIDFRMRVGRSEMSAFDLPAAVGEKLFALLDRLGLVYGAIDMRVTPQGEYYFFEVNTAGEFLFVEDRTGLPISQAIASWLSDPRSATART